MRERFREVSLRRFARGDGGTVMATDKRDKGPHLGHRGLLIRIRAVAPTRSTMEGFSLCLILIACLAQGSGAAEYKVCATAEQESLCKMIESTRTEITCVKVSDSVDCLLKMQKKEADVGTFYPEEALLAERFLQGQGAVLAEVRHPDREDRPFSFETVAVVSGDFHGGLSALKKAKYCHPGFSKAQYWSDRVLKEFERKVLDHFKDDVKCSSALRSAYEDDLYRLSVIFDKACRPGTWAVSDWWDKKLKREYHNLCDQCDRPGTCSYDTRNRGRHSDALRCLTVHGGDVTYTALEFVEEYFRVLEDGYSNPEASKYNLLCPDGSTTPLKPMNSCSWIKQPWTSVIGLTKGSEELSRNLRNWLEEENTGWSGNVKKVLAKGNGIVRFRERPTPVSAYIREGRSIPTPDESSCRSSVRWCTVSKAEKKKCEYVAAAALIHGLPTQLTCVEGSSKLDCLKKINAREADIVYIDSELGYISRKMYNLTAAAYLETQRTANYYGVIIVKENSIKRLKDLQGKRACFPQYNGLGWFTYIETLKSLSVIPSRSCGSSKKAWNYFSKACAPGAKDSTVNLQAKKVPDRLCSGCGSPGSCEFSPKNPYFGETGALKCLENDGDFAFLDYNTIQKVIASGSPKMNLEGLKILCRDNTLESLNLTNPDKCSFTQLNGGEVVSRKDLESVQETDIHYTLLELDDLFGTTSRSYNPAIKMFEPFDGEPNLLFKDSAVSLVSVYQTQNKFVNNYIKLLNSMDNCHDDSGSSVLLPSAFAIAFSIFFVFYQ